MLPPSHITARRALTPPTAMPQAPEIPIAWPRSLMPVAALVESPGRGDSSRISSLPGPQRAAMELALLPAGAAWDPSPVLRPADHLTEVVGRGGEAVFPAPRWGGPGCSRAPRQRPRHVFPVREGKKKRQLQVSPSGWSRFVSATPATRPMTFFEGQSTALFGPPSVPRSVGVAPAPDRRVHGPSPAWAERPPTHPRSLMLFPKLRVPPERAQRDDHVPPPLALPQPGRALRGGCRFLAAGQCAQHRYRPQPRHLASHASSSGAPSAPVVDSEAEWRTGADRCCQLLGEDCHGIQEAIPDGDGRRRSPDP